MFLLSDTLRGRSFCFCPHVSKLMKCPCRASGAMALHMLEVSEAILISAKENRYVQVNTTFERPEAMPQRD